MNVIAPKPFHQWVGKIKSNGKHVCQKCPWLLDVEVAHLGLCHVGCVMRRVSCAVNGHSVARLTLVSSILSVVQRQNARHTVFTHVKAAAKYNMHP